MICLWKELLSILPHWLRGQLAPYEGNLQELRMRCGRPPELVLGAGSKWLPGTVSQDDLNYCVNAASRYSPWAAATVSQGYITAPGGHRLGICGEAVMKDGIMTGIRSVHSICIRVARDFPGLARRIHFRGQAMLILGAPGWGKTTLLRDISRAIAEDDAVAGHSSEHGSIQPSRAGPLRCGRPPLHLPIRSRSHFRRISFTNYSFKFGKAGYNGDIRKKWGFWPL